MKTGMELKMLNVLSVVKRLFLSADNVEVSGAMNKTNNKKSQASQHPLDRLVSVQGQARCHECGRFVSKKELAKVPRNGVPWCDECVGACDSPWY